MEALDTTLYEEGTQVPLNPHTTSSQVSHKDTTVKKALEETVNFTPQNLTPEQQTQARENINALEDEAGVIDEEHIATGAVTTDKIADGAITGDKLASQSVSSKKIKDATIGASKLGVNSVTTAKIKDGAVTKEKLADGVLGGGAEFIDMSPYAELGIKNLLPDDVALRIFDGLTGQDRVINRRLYILGPGNYGVGISGPLFLVGERATVGVDFTFLFSGLIFGYGIGTTPMKIYQMNISFESGHYYCQMEEHPTVNWDPAVLTTGLRHSPLCYNEIFGEYGYHVPIFSQAGIKNWTRILVGIRDSPWYAVPRLTSTQVNALIDKLKTQFPDAGDGEIMGAFARGGYTSRGYILDDDISTIDAVIYGTALYFFER